MPLQRRLPKRGFTNIFKKDYIIINIKDLSRFEANAVLDKAVLREAGLIKKESSGIKLLGEGDISQPLSVRVDKVSKTAKEKIEAAGGRVELL